MITRITAKRVLISLFTSCLIVYSFKFYNCTVMNSSLSGALQAFISGLFSIRALMVVFFGSIFLYFYSENHVRINEWIYKYRFLLAFCLFVLCVIWEISGSSIGFWCACFGEQDNDLIVGISRQIRSDEWAVSTPMAASQYKNYSGSFPYFSDTVRACRTDVFLEYGQAAKTPLIIFRPFYLGYLFLPFAKGLSFFWCGRLIALFLTTFEFGMLITDRRKGLSLAMAFLVTYAPAVQWWFAINGLVEMLIYTQLSVLQFHNFLVGNSFLKRVGYLLVTFICAGGFVLTFYPPWMIPCAYVLIVLVIWVFFRDRKQCSMKLADWVAIAVFLVLFSVSMLYLYSQSKDAISALMNTVYPGSREERGGGVLYRMSLYVSNIWHSIRGDGAVDNVCEASYFVDFFPVCFVLPLLSVIRKKRRDFLLVSLIAVCSLFGAYCIFGFPPVLSRLSFLKYCQAPRVLVILGFSNILLLFRFLSLKDHILSRTISCLLSVALALALVLKIRSLGTDYLHSYYSVITVLVFSVLFYCLFRSTKDNHMVFCCLSVCTVLLASLLANPVRKGVDSVERIACLNRLEELHEEDPSAKWLIEAPFPHNNSGLLKGIPTINSTNVYPALDRWRILDPDGYFEDVYNRYAHVIVHLTESEDASFALILADVFEVNTPINRLHDLQVGYIMSNRDFSNLCDEGVLSCLDRSGPFYFYKVN